MPYCLPGPKFVLHYLAVLHFSRGSISGGLDIIGLYQYVIYYDHSTIFLTRIQECLSNINGGHHCLAVDTTVMTATTTAMS